MDLKGRHSPKKKQSKKFKIYTIAGRSYDLEKDQGQHGWADLNDGNFSVDLSLFHKVSDVETITNDELTESTILSEKILPKDIGQGKGHEQVQGHEGIIENSTRLPSNCDTEGVCDTPSNGSNINVSGEGGITVKDEITNTTVSSLANQPSETSPRKTVDLDGGKINRLTSSLNENDTANDEQLNVWTSGSDPKISKCCSHENLAFDGECEGNDGGKEVDKSPSSGDDVEHDCDDKDVKGATSDRVSSEPLWICKVMISWPVTVFLFFLAIHSAFFIATATLYFTDHNIFPSDFRTTPVTLHHDESVLRALAWNSRWQTPPDHIERFVVDQYKNMPAWIRGFLKETVELFYESEHGNVLTSRDLWMIKDIEDTLMNLKKFATGFCQRDAYSRCIKPLSILRFFDGTYREVNAIFDDKNFTNIAQVLATAERYPETKSKLDNHLALDATIENGTAVSSVTRSFIFFGWPLGVVESSNQMAQQIDEYLDTEFKQTIQMLQEKYKNRIGLYFYHERLYFDDVQAQAMQDLNFAYGSLAFILCFILFHTRSLWISFWAVFSMGGCFFATNLIYRYALGFTYFGFLHILSVFIILGIGADDIFIFYDIWRATGHAQYPSLLQRFSHCYRRAAGAMFATSLTTMVAFFVSGISPLLMVQSFGLFTGFLVLTNYISVITFFPSVIIVYHLKIKPCFKRVCCGCCRNDKCNCNVDDNSNCHDESNGCHDTNGGCHLVVKGSYQENIKSCHNHCKGRSHSDSVKMSNTMVDNTGKEKIVTENLEGLVNQAYVCDQTGLPKVNIISSGVRTCSTCENKESVQRQDEEGLSCTISSSDSGISNVDLKSSANSNLPLGTICNNPKLTDNGSCDRNTNCDKNTNENAGHNESSNDNSGHDRETNDYAGRNGNTNVTGNTSDYTGCIGNTIETGNTEDACDGNTYDSVVHKSCNGKPNSIDLSSRETKHSLSCPKRKNRDDHLYYWSCGRRWKRRRHFLIRFFEGPFFWLISHRILRWFILLGFAAMVATFAYFCTKIVPDEEEIQAYNPKSNYGKSTRMRLYSFKLTERDQMLRMYIVWGLKEQNVTMCDYRNIQNVSDCRGQAVFDDEFDINVPGGQEAMLDLCKKLYDLPPERMKELNIKMDEVTGEPMIDCFMHDMQKYIDEVSKKYMSIPAFSAVDFSIPLNKEKMTLLMNMHSAIYRPSDLPDNFTNWFEIGLGYWMTNQMTLKITDDYTTYNPLLGEKKTPATQRIQGIDIFYGTKMHFAAVVIGTSINARALGYPTGLPLFEKWEQLVAELREDLPPGLNNSFLATPEINIYHWLRVQQSLSHQAIMGLGLGIALAFPVLVFGTQNIIVGILATLSISLSTICVVGIISVAGWKLGVLESVNLCLVIGLSIDYEVHLAQGYYYSTKKYRKDRVKQLLGEVGISVFSGAMTTLGAATFMLFAELQFYLQFGVFMFCTIGFSILFGLAFFTTTLALLGPQNDVGSLTPIWKKIKSCCSAACRKKEQ